MEEFDRPIMSKQLSKWIALPDSKYGITYSLEKLNTNISKKGRIGASRRPLRSIRNTDIVAGGITGNSLSNGGQNVVKRKTRKSPFENYLEGLSLAVRRSIYPEGTALLYIREIFEPDDPEFDFLEADVNVFQLSPEQVGRLKILIVPRRREEYLLAYMEHFNVANKCPHLITSPANVLRHYDGFKRRYCSTRDVKEKLDLIFSFSFAMKKYSSWMHFPESKRALERMLAGLARHWRNLLQCHYPEELGLDREFSYPAIMEFLKRFKEQVECIDVFGTTPIRFQYESSDIFGVFEKPSPSSVISVWES